MEYLLTTDLPFCLRLKNDAYQIIVNGKEYQISTFNYWTKNAENSININAFEDDPERKPTALGLSTPTFSGEHSDYMQIFKGRNVEFIKDDTAHFRKTILEISWSDNVQIFHEDTELQQKKIERLLKILLRVINEFIEKYRISSEEYFKPTLRELPFRSVVRLRSLDEKKSWLEMNLNMRKAKYALSSKAHDIFRNLLKDEYFLTSTKLSMNSAKYWFELNQFRNCLIDVITAIEPIVFKTVRIGWEKQGIPTSKLDSQLNNLDLHHLMVIEIPRLVDMTNQKNKNVIDSMLNSITLRNKAVHDNYDRITDSEANTAIKNAESLIILLDNYMPNNGLELTHTQGNG